MGERERAGGSRAGEGGAHSRKRSQVALDVLQRKRGGLLFEVEERGSVRRNAAILQKHQSHGVAFSGKGGRIQARFAVFSSSGERGRKREDK